MLVIIDFPITSMVNVNFELNSISIAVIRKMIVIAMTFNYHTRKIIKRKKNGEFDIERIYKTLYCNSLSYPRNYFILETDDRG